MSRPEDFKSEINLTEYAAGQGYVLDRKASSRNSAVMRRDDGDKVVIVRGQDRHWIYFSVRDDADHGSIIDFVQNRKGVRLGGVRQALRSWLGGSQTVTRPRPDLFAREIAPVSRDRAQVLLELARMKLLGFHRYLEEERHIPRAVLQSPRFAGRLKVDYRSNAIFPHADKDGPCGYEIKNHGFTGFARGAGRRDCGSPPSRARTPPWCSPRAASMPCPMLPCTRTGMPASPAPAGP